MMRIPMFGQISSGYNARTDKVRIPMFGRIRLEFQCLERYSQNSNVWKDKPKILIF